MNILDYLADMGIDENRVQEIAGKLERLADKYLEEIPVLDTRLQAIHSQLVDICAIAKVIPVILEKESKMEQDITDQKHSIRELNSRFLELLHLKIEVAHLKKAVFVIISLMIGITAATIRHIFSIP